MRLTERAAGLPPKINADRMLRRIDELASIGSDAAGGITRPGFSAADREARAYLVAQARADDLTATVDPAGNIFIRRPGSAPGRPMLAMGSHADTVISAGRLDGAYGVLAAIEVLSAMPEADQACEPVAVVFANEEGALYPQPFWGSMAFVGRHQLDPRANPILSDASLSDAIALAGGDLDRLAQAQCPPGALAAYLELHIEQGTVLERTGARIGVVDGISGRVILTLRISGAAGHAGTTPMNGRHDALIAAAHLTLAVQGIARDQRLCESATVGRMEPFPNTANTIAQEVSLTVDLRDVSPERLSAAEGALGSAASAIASDTGTEITQVAATRAAPASTDPAISAQIARGAADLGLPSAWLPSGAGHDAQVVASIAPIGMIFVPSIGGISHAPAEDTADSDLVAGAQVLLLTALRLVCPRAEGGHRRRARQAGASG